MITLPQKVLKTFLSIKSYQVYYCTCIECATYSSASFSSIVNIVSIMMCCDMLVYDLITSLFLFFLKLQRETIQAASNFAIRNRIPDRLLNQMLAHLSLSYRTGSEGLQQQEILDGLPKAIQSSISHFLFYTVVDKVYLFRGVSSDLLFQLVTTKTALYFCWWFSFILKHVLAKEVISGRVCILFQVLLVGSGINE